MAEELGGRSATRSTFLELEDERRFVQEGYEFLDEKRMLLAAELLRQLGHYNDTYARYLRINERAMQQLKRGVYRHGLDGLTIYPPLALSEPRVDLEQHTVLGVRLLKVRVQLTGSQMQYPALNPSPEANRCAQVFQTLLGIAVELAVISGNLYRLCDEYTRTKHRARALEKIVIPELDAVLKMIDEQLEVLDQEDVLRVRFRKS